MLYALAAIMFFVLVTVIGVSIVPLITVIWFKVKKPKTITIFLFSSELLEAEYSDSYFAYLNGDFEEKKSEVYNGMQLP